MVSEQGLQTPDIEIDLSRIPVKPTSAKEVRELEIALIIATMFRPDVFQEILHPREFTTWLDSLAVAAGALAREKAGYPISKIAEDLGRSEATIRNHLQGKTKAGRLVRETYEQLVRGKIRIVAVGQMTLRPEPSVQAEQLKRRVDALEQAVKRALEAIETAREALEEVVKRGDGGGEEE